MFRAFFFRRPATLESAPTRSLPRGGGLGRGHSPNCGNLSQFPNRLKYKPCGLLPSLWLSPTGREDGVAVGVKGSARKQVVQTAFYFSDDLHQWFKSKLLFKPPATAKPAATRSLPRGGGLGRGHSPNCGNLSQYPNCPNTSLAACYPLSNSLPRERGWGGCWD